MDRDEAEAFCQEHGIALLTDPDHKPIVRGSFPIIEVNQLDVKLVREGHFPGYLFHYLLGGAEVEMVGATPANVHIVITQREGSVPTKPRPSTRRDNSASGR